LTQRAKLIERTCSKPAEARFRDVERLLEAFGWTAIRQRGSHVTFSQPGERPITVPIRDGKVGRVYLADICSRLGLDDEF
jgi:predicted RNA binding protein YcfA (HicA-like mRNA interferase family)